MTNAPNPDKTAPPADHAVSGPEAASRGFDDEAVGEAQLQAKVRLARNTEADPADPTDRKRGMPDLQISRLSPALLVVLGTGALALIVVLIIFGGLT